jgi:hypothetical protein
VLQVDARGVKKAGKKGNIDIFKDKYNWRGPAMFEGAWAEEAARVANTLPLAARFSVLNVSFLDARADGHVAGAMPNGHLSVVLDGKVAGVPGARREVEKLVPRVVGTWHDSP